jgi:hypothetical protein
MTLLINPNLKAEPTWSKKIERWHQLDEISYCFCEAVSQWNYCSEFPRPETIIFSTPGASNLSDLEFVETGALSPAKFVYTLPNICASVVLQLLAFKGQVLFLHQGSTTEEFSLSEGRARAKAGQIVWIFSSPPLLINSTEGPLRRVSFECIRPDQ